MAWTACFVLDAGELESLDAERLWELWRLLGFRGLTGTSASLWSAGPGDDLEVTLTPRRELPVGTDRPRFDELRLQTATATRGAVWRLFNRDLPAVAAIVGARLVWAMSDTELEEQAELMTVHRSLRSGQLAGFDPTLLGVPTGSELEAQLALRGPVTHDSGFALRRRPVAL